MGHNKMTPERLLRLVLLEFDENLTIEACAAELQIGERTIYHWHDKPEYKEVLRQYVDKLEEEVVPRSLALLLRLVKRGDRKAAVELLRVYKGAKLKVEGEVTLHQWVRNVLNGSNGREADG